MVFFVGVPNKFFLRMSLTLPPVFTSLRFGLSGLGVTLPEAFASGVAARLGVIFF